ncbi:MAG TPA: ATP-binding protein [Gemmatimonadaceae bacterium]|nr:ATP-binding protein [Gemmatimonadaceae bacterium]
MFGDRDSDQAALSSPRPDVAQVALTGVVRPASMADRIEAFDWSRTAVGPAAEWTSQLRAFVRLLLDASEPMLLFWTRELVQFYNDAYRPLIDPAREPFALGAAARAFWADAWPVVGGELDDILAGAPGTWHEDRRVPVVRDGRLSEAFWTYGYTPVRDDERGVVGILVTVHETTDAVLAQAARDDAADRQRRQLEAITANATLALFVMDEHQVCTYMNPAAERLTGFRLGEVQGRPLHDVVHHTRPDGTPYPLAECPIDRAFPRNMREQGEETFVHRDGSFYPVAFTASPIHENGRAVGTVIEVRDVRAERSREAERDGLLAAAQAARADAERATREEQAARERTQRLHALTAALATASTERDVASSAVRHAAAIFGGAATILARYLAADEALEILDVDALDAAVRQDWQRIPMAVRAPLTDAARAREPIFLASRAEWLDRYPHLVHLADAEGHEANAVVPLVADEMVLGVLGVAFTRPTEFSADDRALAITVGRQVAQAMQRARLFESERRAREAAERADRTKSRYLAVLSHELRTPLNAVGGYAELLALGVHGPMTEEQRGVALRMQQVQRHLLGLINQVLDFARLESGAVSYDRKPTDISEAIASAVPLVQPLIQAKGVRIDVHRTADVGAVVLAWADPPKLQQVLVNLLSNAVKFTAPGGEVALRLELDQPHGRVRVHVHDTGIGISPEQLASIFEPFVRIEDARAGAPEGTGLGLAISRELVQGMGGELTAESAPGVGSVFTVSLPLCV